MASRKMPAFWKFSFIMGRGRDGGDDYDTFMASEEEGATARAEFLRNNRLDPPRFLRVIDCELSVQKYEVVITDFPIKDYRQASAGSSSGGGPGYTAISHTYGQDVYDAFNCCCAADCQASVARADPKKECNHEKPEEQRSLIGDVLAMCRLLVGAEVRYAWHDGVCIAQHDKEEVTHFIEHIAWIYANADDTVIFLHYIGQPMAPIAPPSYPDGPISRWQTRVWTFQEAALSKRRRYCVRRGASTLISDKFEQILASWYEPNIGSNFTPILDEHEFFYLVRELFWGTTALSKRTESWNAVHDEWRDCLVTWMQLLWYMRTSFPTIAHALESCSSRDSKHEGDRINSILGLAGVKDFSAPKDVEIEEYTMDFFMRMKKAGLAIALFTSNQFKATNARRPHTWYPTLSSPLHFTPSHFHPSGPDFHTDHLEFKVRSEDGRLEVRGRLACVSLHVTLVPDIEDGIGETWIDNAAMSSQSLSTVADFRRYTDFHSSVSNLWLANDRTLGVLGSPLTAASEKFSTFNLIFPAEILDILDGDDDEILDEQGSYFWKNHNHRFAAVMVRGGGGGGDGGGVAVVRRYGELAVVEKVGCFFPAEILEILEILDGDDNEILDGDDSEILDEIFLFEKGSRRLAAVIGGGDGCRLSSDDELGVVEKVGCFIGTPKLRQLLQQKPEYVNILPKVVIK